jgi:hypothetical protein
MGKSNAQRQAEYRERHIKAEEGQGVRLSMVVDLHAKKALERLAACYRVTQREALEKALAAAERTALDQLDAEGQARYYAGAGSGENTQ